MLNRITLIGRLTADPAIRTTTTGRSVASFTLAVPKRIRPQDPKYADSDFLPVMTWGQVAEYVSNYMTKGRLVAVDGRVENRDVAAEDGTARQEFWVVADNVTCLDRPREGWLADPNAMEVERTGT